MSLKRLKHVWNSVRRSKTFEVFGRFWAWQPLTGRGVLAAILGTLAIRVFALPEYDLVADVIGTSALALVTLSVLSAILFRILIASRLSAEIHFENSNAVSKTPIPGVIILRGSSIPPFFVLHLNRIFEHAGVNSPTHIIRGKFPSDTARYLTDELVFPHRGYWELRALHCRLEDSLGFTRLSWRIPVVAGIEVGVADLPIEPLPIIASSARAGDELTQSRERSGDLFDIKAYDPSDGVKRILWKTYAKSGQVVVRRPEPAVIPEGEIALYLVAGAEDDYVVGALQSYLKQLADSQVNVLFRTDGIAQAGIEAPHGILRREEDIVHAINRCVWGDTAGTAADFPSLLSALESTAQFTSHIVVFGAAKGSWSKSVSAEAARAGIKVHLALVPEEVDPEVSYKLVSGASQFDEVLDGFPAGVKNFLRRFLPGRGNTRVNSVISTLSTDALSSGADLYVVKGRGGFG